MQTKLFLLLLRLQSQTSAKPTMIGFVETISWGPLRDAQVREMSEMVRKCCLDVIIEEKDAKKEAIEIIQID